MNNPKKPTGSKNYGSIGHLPNSRLGPADHKITDGQAAICCVKKRDKHDRIIVQEKLDGSNVGVAKIDGTLYPLTRSGYVANTSPYEQHHRFYNWAHENLARFDDLLRDGERAVGEWMYQSHGTLYDLPHEPFVLFDIMNGKERCTFSEVSERCSGYFTIPHTLLAAHGDSIPLADALSYFGEHGKHGAIDPIEGVMYRVERNNLIDKKKGGERRWEVDYLAKYVKPEKRDGCYLESVTGKPPIINTFRVGPRDVYK